MHAPLEIVHVDFTSMESTMELNKPPSIKNVLVITDHFIHYTLAIVTKDQMAKTVVRVVDGTMPHEAVILPSMVPGRHPKGLLQYSACQQSSLATRDKLYLSACGRVVCHVRHSEMLDHHVPFKIQWTS